MAPDLNDNVALVTGAGRGIGKAIAVAVAKCSAHVYLVSRTENELQRTAEEIRAAGGRATPVVTDLTDEKQIERLFQTITKSSGRLDILINNAAVGHFGKVKDFSADQLDQIFSINVRGTFLCCREAVRLMEPAKRGYIINISSVVGFKGYPDQAAYAASKHAMMGLTKSLAVECQPAGIRVSAILPGGVDTEMVAAARPDLDRSVLMQPADIATTVLYLLSLWPTNAMVDQIYIRRKAAAPF